jgi:4-hydroxy-3-polyprenylbenzoate decarboxylase
LPTQVPSELRLPDGFRDPRVALPGVLAVQAPRFEASRERERPEDVDRFCESFQMNGAINAFPLMVLVDDSEFTARALNNFLWVTFTRSNPAADIAGIGAFTERKHWGCRGSLVIDARTKPQHAPPLVEDAAITKRVNALAAPGGVLHGII